MLFNASNLCLMNETMTRDCMDQVHRLTIDGVFVIWTNQITAVITGNC